MLVARRGEIYRCLVKAKLLNEPEFYIASFTHVLTRFDAELERRRIQILDPHLLDDVPDETINVPDGETES